MKKIYIFWNTLLRQIVPFSLWCQIVPFYIAVPNCPLLHCVAKLSWCQIVLFHTAVPNCPRCQIVLEISAVLRASLICTIFRMITHGCSTISYMMVSRMQHLDVQCQHHSVVRPIFNKQKDFLSISSLEYCAQSRLSFLRSGCWLVVWVHLKLLSNCKPSFPILATVDMHLVLVRSSKMKPFAHINGGGIP